MLHSNICIVWVTEIAYFFAIWEINITQDIFWALFDSLKSRDKMFRKFYLSTKTSWRSRVAYPCRRIRTVSRIPVYRNCARTNSGWKRFACFWWFGLRHLPKKKDSISMISRTVKNVSIHTFLFHYRDRSDVICIHTWQSGVEHLTVYSWGHSVNSERKKKV